VLGEIVYFRELESWERLGASGNWSVGRDWVLQGTGVLGEIGYFKELEGWERIC